ncbi:hypothetical protein [Arthrobacter bambusae]|uniref:Uncharacterized protein n=1 Tax=Arthrobacter bambusae TaxID=1338426 RepID=A0AAW8DCT1_9MICC|nr:hypothetical protein [Arthrobacter bambusae]MDP9903100.1 hypothetical protein [Arthrobacter bambusae]MDQ0128906.1 hypothetical protein [Arthrobacter bambusae]
MATIAGLVLSVTSLILSTEIFNAGQRATESALDVQSAGWFSSTFPEFTGPDGKPLMPDTSGTQAKNAGTPIGLFLVSNVGRTAETITGIEQTDTSGSRYSVNAVTIVSAGVARTTAYGPVFVIAPGESVLVAAGLTSTSFFGSDAKTLEFTAKHSDKSLTVDLSRIKLDGKNGLDCSGHNASLCRWADSQIVASLKDSAKELYWMCLPKMDVLDQIPSLQRTVCDKWLKENNWRSISDP